MSIRQSLGHGGNLKRHFARTVTHEVDRSTSSQMSASETEAFLHGEWVDTPGSTMVARARFAMNVRERLVDGEWEDIPGVSSEGRLEVVFVKSGVHWWYPCDRMEAQAFAEAPSKGGFLHDNWIRRGVPGSAV